MKVTFMELRETGDLDLDTVLIQIEELFVITVKGYGTGGYHWKMHTCAHNKEDWDYSKSLEDLYGKPNAEGFYEGRKTLGDCLVWVEPRTFAHVIYDLVRNQ